MRQPPASTLFPYTTLFRSLLICAVALLVSALVLPPVRRFRPWRSEEHTSELQSRLHLVCRLLLEKKKASADPSGDQVRCTSPSARVASVLVIRVAARTRWP